MNVESFVEKTLFASRWLLCPLYIGLAFLLVLFSIHFFRELIDIAIRAFSLSETDLVTEALTLIDLALAGGLVVMIMLSRYENYVSKLDVVDAEKSISWLGKLDTGTLKLKVSATIVTISAVQLLKAYLEINTVPNDKLLWLVVIHLT